MGVQLTLLQPGGQIMLTTLLLAHPDLKNPAASLDRTDWRSHQFLGTKTTEANQLLKTDAKTVLFKTIRLTILCARALMPLNYAKHNKNKANHELQNYVSKPCLM